MPPQCFKEVIRPCHSDQRKFLRGKAQLVAAIFNENHVADRSENKPAEEIPGEQKGGVTHCRCFMSSTPRLVPHLWLPRGQFSGVCDVWRFVAVRSAPAKGSTDRR